jgi:hypothetical protein
MRVVTAARGAALAVAVVVAAYLFLFMNELWPEQ